jgi:hypothetical protein
MAWMSAKTWKRPPSEIYKIAKTHGEYAAYCFDKAVMLFGNAYEADMHDAAMNAKTTSDSKRAIGIVQQRWLNDEPFPDSAPDDDKPKFRDPIQAFAKVRESHG